MPIYEYRCSRCEHEFEAWQKMSEEPVKVCPKCRGRKVERLISTTSFQLKGSGWYATDYAASKAGGGKKKPSSGEGSSGSGSSGSGSGASGSGGGASGSGGGASESGDKPAGDESPGGKGRTALGAGEKQARAAAAA